MSDGAKRKSSKVVFWLGCASVAFVLMLVAVGAIMWWMLRRERRETQEAQRLPAGWMDSVRARYRLPPEVSQAALPHTEDGDAAALLGVGLSGGRDSVSRLRTRASTLLAQGEAITAEDSATIRATFADTTLDRFVRAARQRRYQPQLPRLDTAASGLYPPFGSGPRIANLSWVSRAVVGLALRVRARLDRRDLSTARTEIGALIGVGELMYQSEVTWLGLMVARTAIREGARGLERYAAMARDSAAAARVMAIRAWVSNRDRWSYFGAIYRYPDSALALAADRSVPRGLRTEALGVGVQGSMLASAWRLVWGPPGRTLASVRALESDTDPAVALAAEVGDSTLTRVRRLGLVGRARLALGLVRRR